MLETDENGYYMFDEHSCRFDVKVSYINSSDYMPYSAQYEQDTDSNDDIMSIEIPVSTYTETDRESL